MKVSSSTSIPKRAVHKKTTYWTYGVVVMMLAWGLRLDLKFKSTVSPEKSLGNFKPVITAPGDLWENIQG